ncbi:MAG: carboxypeptidase regulatory-like domain-containing protein [Acidobacteriia bacterium]|nr:carboxypeptidase regulatory-like domain-containing protein [Terriglobia bacterium]
MRTRISLRLWAIFSILLFLAATPVLAQSQGSTGQIAGIVTDQTGAAIPSAKVTVVNPATGLTRELLTNDVGQYRALSLPPAKYTVTVEKQGFSTAKEPDVVVTVGSAIDLNITLQVGGLSQVVEVSAAQLEVTRSEAGATLNDDYISNLPINGRRFHDFVTITPTVQVEPQRQQLSFVGQRGINGNVNIDGADYNEPFFGGLRGGERSNLAFTIPQESIQEFQVVAQGYSAEFGRSTGGLVNAVTKSGTNEIHGTIFSLTRLKGLGANNAFGQRAVTNQWQEGGSAGGPIRKDKTFFFGSIERQDQRIPRQVGFTALNNVVRDATNSEAFDFFKTLEGPYTATNDATAFLVKIDNNFGIKNRLSVRYNYSRNTGLNAVNAGTQIDPTTNTALTNNGTEGDRIHTIAGQLTTVFSSNLLNELRMQYSREERPRDANAIATTVEASGVGSFGTVSFLPTTATDYRIQLSNSIAWTKGGHSIRVGGEYNYTNIFQLFAFDQSGAFRFTGSNPTTNLQIMSLNAAQPTKNRFDNTTAFYQHALGNGTLGAGANGLAFFAQDNWRISRRFTLNYGLRWEAALNPPPEANNTSMINKVQNLTFPVGLSFDPNFIPDQTKQFAPRLGFAFDPKGDGTTVIRGNAGVFYAPTPLLVFSNPLNNFRIPPGDLRIRLPLAVPAGNPNNTVYKQLLAIGIDLNKFTLGNLPILTVQQVQSIATALGLTFDPFAGAGPLGMARDFENPRSFQWALGVEHELAKGITAGADFYYVNTVHLERNHELDLPAPTLRAADGRFVYNVPSLIRPVSSLSSVQIRESSARSLYKGLVFRLNYARTKLQMKAFYTLSWNYSDDDNERSSGGSDAVDQFHLNLDYGFSRLDRRHQFSWITNYTLPWGFEISSNARIYSGISLNAAAGSDMNGDAISTDRPYSAPGVIFPRNSFRNQPIYNVDMRLSKTFKFKGDRFGLQFLADFFNVFNFDNVQIGSTNSRYGVGIDATGATVAPLTSFQRIFLADGTYDKNNSPGPPFQTQLGIRFTF